MQVDTIRRPWPHWRLIASASWMALLTLTAIEAVPDIRTACSFVGYANQILCSPEPAIVGAWPVWSLVCALALVSSGRALGQRPSRDPLTFAAVAVGVVGLAPMIYVVAIPFGALFPVLLAAASVKRFSTQPTLVRAGLLTLAVAAGMFVLRAGTFDSGAEFYLVWVPYGLAAAACALCSTGLVLETMRPLIAVIAPQGDGAA